MNQRREITPIIEDHVQGFAILECYQSLFNTPDEFLLSFAFPGKDRNANSSDATIKASSKRSQRRGTRQHTQQRHDLE
jgi:hypothetical protein